MTQCSCSLWISADTSERGKETKISERIVRLVEKFRTVSCLTSVWKKATCQWSEVKRGRDLELVSDTSLYSTLATAQTHILSLTFVACECDLTGSFSAVCMPMGGQCECKNNVIGRRCDQCAPGHYGFGPQGCFRTFCISIRVFSSLCLYVFEQKKLPFNRNPKELKRSL